MKTLNERVREVLYKVDYKSHMEQYHLENYDVIWNSLKHLFSDFDVEDTLLKETFIEEFEWWDEDNFHTFI